jgi:hypothetical protein
MRPALSWIAVLLVTIWAPGCRGTPTSEREKVSVEGKVTHAGQGVAWVLVTFNGATPDVRFETHTEKDGTFRLSCSPGTYKVSFTAVPLGQGQGPSAGAGDGTLANSPDASNLKEIPRPYRSPSTSPLTVEVPAEGKSDLLLPIN